MDLGRIDERPESGDSQGKKEGFEEDELRKMLAFSVDLPPPVPPKDPPRPGTSSSAASKSTYRAPAPPLGSSATPAPLQISKPGTPVNTNPPGTPASTVTTRTEATAPRPRPTLAGTMSSNKRSHSRASSKSKTPGATIPALYSLYSTMPSSRPSTNASNAPTLVAPTPTKPTPAASPSTSRVASPVPAAAAAAAIGGTMSTSAAGTTSSPSNKTKVGMSPLKPVTIAAPLRSAIKSMSIKRSNSDASEMSEMSMEKSLLADPEKMGTNMPEPAQLPPLPALPAEPPQSPKKRPLTGSTSTTLVGRLSRYGKDNPPWIELSPQPSDDEEDPLNWPLWKKDLNLFSILFTVALVNCMKTAFIPTGAEAAATFDASQIEVAALTGVPLILSALTGMAALTASKLWGKRPVYLLSMVLLFIGTLWNMRAETYGDTMGARVFQGLGWGAFDTLPLPTMHDSFFQHQRGSRVAVYDLVNALTTWGPPMLAGVAARDSSSWTMHFQLINIFYVFSIPLLAFAAPETAYDRWFSGSSGPATASSRMTPTWTAAQRSIGRFHFRVPTKLELQKYLQHMAPLSSFRGHRNARTIFQAPRALAAPTTVLLSLSGFLPTGMLWGLAFALSPLFSEALGNNPANVGAMLAGPFVMSLLTLVAAIFYWRRFALDFSMTVLLACVGAGKVLSFIGILGFGLDTYDSVMEEGADRADMPATSNDLGFAGLSFLLGLLAVGAYILQAAARPVAWRSATYTSSNLHVSLRSTADMEAGVVCWRSFFAGVLIIGVANAIQGSVRPELDPVVAGTGGLSDIVIGVGVSQLLITSAAAAIWWYFDDKITTWDGRIMGMVDLGMLGKDGSFFDLE